MTKLFLALTLAMPGPLPTNMPFPTDNPPSLEKVELGRQLFLDPRLSKSGKTSCLSCHDIKTSGENNQAFAIVPSGKHSKHPVPTVFNSGFLQSYFWTGDAASLEEQAEGPLEEMSEGNLDLVAQNVNAIPEYVIQFKNIFGPDQPIDLGSITKAIASFERTLNTPNSAYDKFKKGDSQALPEPALEGYKLFQRVGCLNCHNGINFDGGFQKFPAFSGSDLEKKYDLSSDLGRFYVTKKDEDKNVFRVPPLRNIARTAPYFHNGSVSDLSEAVRVMAKTQLNLELAEPRVQSLVQFLKSLSGEIPEINTAPK